MSITVRQLQSQGYDSAYDVRANGYYIRRDGREDLRYTKSHKSEGMAWLEAKSKYRAEQGVTNG
jgi:hypothetical protein